MSTHAYIAAAREVAKVTFLSDDKLFVRAALRNRTSLDVTFAEPTGLLVGDVVFVDAERDEIEPAPAGLWPTELWIGVVRLVADDVTVVSDPSGHLRRLRRGTDMAYELGNTVECDDDGVVRVLSERPVRSFDLRDDDVDLTPFIPESIDEGTSFEDFAGFKDIVDRARELVEVPLQHRQALAEIGARAIKGVLFTGPPGTGKTMLARIIARQSGAQFFAVSGPTIFSKWYGESENVLRHIFAQAAAQQPSIIFFDELDSVAVKRDANAHEASKRVVGQLLTLMDGFEKNDNVIVIAATNRRDAIDEALLRPGRFDWEIEFRLPEARDRRLILERAGTKVKQRGPQPLRLISERSAGWSAAELALVWSEAALLAVVDDRRFVVAEDLLGGFERVAVGQRRAAAERAEAAS